MGRKEDVRNVRAKWIAVSPVILKTKWKRRNRLNLNFLT